MNLYVSHLSALRFWRNHDLVPDVFESTPQECTLADATTRLKDVKDLELKRYGIVMSDTLPLDALVASARRRRPSHCIHPRVWGSAIAPDSFMRIAANLYISSPEFTYLQLAGGLDEIELARLAAELCGTYSLTTHNGYTSRSQPLTSKQQLIDYVTASVGSYGAVKAREALRWICDNSGSPEETNLQLAFCLPGRCGGFGLPLPNLNASLARGLAMHSLTSAYPRQANCLWTRRVGRRTFRAVVDCNSINDFLDEEQADARCTRFKALGCDATLIGRSHMASVDSLVADVCEIRRHLGLKKRSYSPRHKSACRQLLNQLSSADVL